MRGKKLIVVLVLLGLLTFGAVVPLPAHADLTDPWVLAGLVTAGYIATIFVATTIVYQDQPFTVPAVPPDVPRKAERHRRTVHFGSGCTQRSTNLTLLCW